MSPTVAPLRTRLTLEPLDDRIVPASVYVVPTADPADGITTFHTLTAALPAAGPGGSVTIQAGATPDAGPVTVAQNGVLVQGEPSQPVESLPRYDLNVVGQSIWLDHLNLGHVTTSAASGINRLHRSLVHEPLIDASFTEIDFNTFLAPVQHQSGFIRWNTFASTAEAGGAMLTVLGGYIIQENTFSGVGYTVGLALTGLGPNVVGNTITLRTPGGARGIVVTNAGSDLELGSVSNNRISTGDGSGLVLDLVQAGRFEYSVEGNDFHDNAIGVIYDGAGESGIGSTLGGQTQIWTSSTFSDGGNNFRSFPGPGTATSASIVLRNVGAGAILPASDNIFANNTPSGLYVESGSIYATALTADRARISTLYADALGFAPDAREIDYWLATGADGPTLASRLGLSTGALNRYVTGLYLEHLKRLPNQLEVNFHVNLLLTGQATPTQVQTGFLTSPEYRLMLSENWVPLLFVELLGRWGTAAEVAYYQQKLADWGAAAVVNGFLHAPEYRAGQIADEYWRLLHRPVTIDELATHLFWPTDLFEIRIGLFSSDEYFHFA